MIIKNTYKNFLLSPSRLVFAEGPAPVMEFSKQEADIASQVETDKKKLNKIIEDGSFETAENPNNPGLKKEIQKEALPEVKKALKSLDGLEDALARRGIEKKKDVSPEQLQAKMDAAFGEKKEETPDIF